MTDQAPDLNVKSSVRALLADAIDYAGLFPPAALSMAEAVINYAMYRNSNFGWMLGRFVVPVGRLVEFIESAGDFISADADKGWRISVIAGPDLDDTVRLIDDFNLHHEPGAVIDSVEIKVDTSAEIIRTVGAMPERITAYFETGLGESFPELVAELALTGQSAKIRTGGVTSEAFPRTGEVVRFVRTCLAANVPFKATAGLHHPVRCFRPLTYEDNAPTGTMHGFLNLFLMTGFARAGFRPPFLEDIMEDEFEEVFRFDKQMVTWREDYSLNIREIQNLRKYGIHSFGSCSFDEPAAELQKLGIL